MELATLNLIRDFTKRIRREEDFLRELRACSLATTKELDGLPRPTGYVRDRIGGLVAAIIDLQNVISELYMIRAWCRGELVELLFAVEELSETERKVLLNKFVRLKTMPETLEELEISERTYFIAQANAFDKLNIRRSGVHYTEWNGQ